MTPKIVLALKQTVIIAACDNGTEIAPQQTGKVLALPESNGMLVVEVEPENEHDDGLREVSIDQLRCAAVCDDKGHLTCEPYTLDNLHLIAEALSVERCWFHKDHYDVPKWRIEEISAKCRRVE